MSSLIEGARKVFKRGASLDSRVAGLAEAVEHARGRLDDDAVDRAEKVVERASTRLRLSANHTVVALAGATGSGKSSTFNQLAGLDLAAVGVRRPTTSWATACIWGGEGAQELLEWLGIPARHQVVRSSMLDGGKDSADLDGLVLLDLPDHDSTEVSHHLEVERLIELTDAMVWILDPQKYADAAIHDRFLKPLAKHAEVMIVALNHIDEVPEGRRESMLADVKRLLAQDGLADVPVFAISARTGEGIGELKALIAKRVAGKAATSTRIAADVAQAAAELQGHSGVGEAPALGAKDERELVDAVADAAGVPVVVDAVRRSTQIRARRATGWPVTSWLGKLRPDPLKRLHLDLGREGRDLVAASRSSIPRANPVQEAKVESAVRGVADTMSADLPRPWANAVRRASVSRTHDLSDRLDKAVGAVELGVAGIPWWCSVVRVLQWLLLVSAVAGGIWLGGLAVMGYLQMPTPDTPSYRGFPVPTLMLLGGILAGILLALLSRVLVNLTARRRAARAEQRLRAAVEEVTDELVVAPMRVEVEAHARVRAGLEAAQRGGRKG